MRQPQPAQPTVDRVRVVLLDDHQGILDGYAHRLGADPAIEIVAAVHFGSELESVLARTPVDVVILDISVPTAPNNPNPYPILHVIPALRQRYRDLAVLVISMLSERALVRAVIDAGASGYVLKDDVETIKRLGAVVATVAGGGVCFSQRIHALIHRGAPGPRESVLTPRQLEALSVVAAYPGAAESFLADKLSIRPATLRNLLSGAYGRLGVGNRTEAILTAQRLGLITPASGAPPP